MSFNPLRTRSESSAWVLMARIGSEGIDDPFCALRPAPCALRISAKGAPAAMKALERMPEVEGAWAVSGEFDYMVLLCCDCTELLDELLDRLGQIEGIQQTQTSIVLSQKIDRRNPQ